MAKDTKKSAVKTQRIGCLAFLLLFVCLALWGQSYFKGAEPKVPTLGTIRLAEVRAAHPLYEELQTKQKEAVLLEKRVKALQATAKHQVEKRDLLPPQITQAPFADQAREKNALDLVGGRIALERKKQAIAEQEKAHAAHEERELLDAESQNELLNLRLKLDNAEAMKLSRESVAQMETRLAALQEERARRQAERKRAWQEEIEARAQASVAEERAELMERGRVARAAARAEGVIEQSAAQARDAAALAEGLAELENASSDVQELSALVSQLEDRRKEILLLERQIAQDIEEKAKVLAQKHQLELVLSNPAPLPFPENGQEQAYGRVFPVHGTDLTAELVAALRMR